MPDDAKANGPAPEWGLPSLPSPERLQQLLFDAARLGRADMVPLLHCAGADLEGRDAGGHTALILASYHGSLETTRALLDEGARANTPDPARGNTALMGAAFNGFTEIVRCLLAGGADPNSRNRVGQTALMMAALFGRGAIADELIAAGGDVSLTDCAGNSARSLAVGQGDGTMLMLLDVACTQVESLDG